MCADRDDLYITCLPYALSAKISLKGFSHFLICLWLNIFVLVTLAS
jgi:hypothetical protein